MSTGTVSPSPPPSSRPETPLGAASRFLHINEKGIDKVIKRRLPLRSVTMNKVRTVEAAPAMEGPAEQADQAKNTTAQVSPSRRLIQNSKLAANRRQFQSTQNLASEESASLISTDLEAANRPTTTSIAPRGSYRVFFRELTTLNNSCCVFLFLLLLCVFVVVESMG